MAHDNPSTRPRTWVIIIGMGLLALAIRWYYVVHADVMQPVYLPEARGDAVDYYRYGWNLAMHGVFARDLPGAVILHPDSFRDPGYPVLMAFWLRVLGGDWQLFYGAMLLTQAALGGATVSLLMFALRRSLGTAAMVVAGTLMALWPHSVAAVSFLLSEVLFAFLMALALALWSEAVARRSIVLGILAGASFAAAALSNAVLAPFAPMMGALVALTSPKYRTVAIALLLTSLLGPLAWMARNVSLPAAASAGDRAAMNLVEGSWPSYHDAFQRSMNGHKDAVAQMQAIDDEIAAFHHGYAHGVGLILGRMNIAPWHYIAWYASKPALLWQWDIRIGHGDIYTYATRYSPYTDSGPMIAVWAICRRLNPLLAILALGACVIVLATAKRKDPTFPLIAACLLLYATGVYSVLQSEPRYSVAFRGIEIGLAIVAVQALAQHARKARCPAGNI